MSVQKKIKAVVRLELTTGGALTSVVAPRLGAHGANIPLFCKSFDEATASYQRSVPVRCIVTVYEDRSFSFVLKGSPVPFLIKEILSRRAPVVDEKANAVLANVPKKASPQKKKSGASESKAPNSSVVHFGVVSVKGSSKPGKSIIGTLTMDDLRLIFDQKKEHMNCYDEQAGFKIIAGVAASMGVLVDWNS